MFAFYRFVQPLAITSNKRLYKSWGHFILCSGFDDRFCHTRIIRQHYVFMVDTLDAKHSGLVGELAEVLSKEERDTINSEVMSFTQNEKLLSVLSRKTNDQFDKFLDALDTTGQQHVRNHVTGRQRQLFCYPHRLCRSAWVGLSSPSVCLFVRSITQKRMNPKCSNSVWRMILGYHRSDTVWGFKGQRSKSQGQ